MGLVGSVKVKVRYSLRLFRSEIYSWCKTRVLWQNKVVVRIILYDVGLGMLMSRLEFKFQLFSGRPRSKYTL